MYKKHNMKKQEKISKYVDNEVTMEEKPYISKEEYEEIFNIQTEINELKVKFFDFNRDKKNVEFQMKTLDSTLEQLKMYIEHLEEKVGEKENFSKQRINEIIQKHNTCGNVTIDISEPHYIHEII